MPSTAAKNRLIERLRGALDDGMSMAEVAAAAERRGLFDDDLLDLREGRARAAAGSYTQPAQRLLRSGGKSRGGPPTAVDTLVAGIGTKLSLLGAKTSVIEARQRLARHREAPTPKPDDVVGVAPVFNHAKHEPRTPADLAQRPVGSRAARPVRLPATVAGAAGTSTRQMNEQSVVWHEAGHAVVALACGLEVKVAVATPTSGIVRLAVRAPSMGGPLVQARRPNGRMACRGPGRCRGHEARSGRG